jgi:hypothetical protein
MSAPFTGSGRRRLLRVLDVASVGLLLGAATLWLWPVSLPSGSPVRMESGLAAERDSLAPGVMAGMSSGLAATDSLLATVVSGNVFSATRRAPRTRFVVPGQEAAAPANVMAGTMEPTAGDSLAGGTEVYPRLSGIVGASGERRALLQLNAADGAPRLYRVGDVHAGYRVVRIDPASVVLSSRTGTRTVRLSPRVTPDSLEMMP